MTSIDLSKLTVPQLKALCKERRITGYSKLSKAALLQKLAEVAALATPPNDQVSSSVLAPTITPVKELGNPPAYIESSTACHGGNTPKVVHQPVQQVATESTGTTTIACISAGPLKSLQSRTTTSTTSTRTKKTTSTKRSAHIDISSAPKRVKTSIERATPTRQEDVAHQPVQPAIAGNTESTRTSVTMTSASTGIPRSSQNRPATNTHNTSGTKRPPHIDISAISKPVKTTTAGHDAPVPGTFTSQQKLPAHSFAFKVPQLPAQRKQSFHAPIIVRQLPGTTNRSTAPPQITGSTGRFKPLVVSRSQPVEPNQINMEPSRAPAFSVMRREFDSRPVSDIQTTPLPVLSHISFPPKASERKLAYRWAIILSAVFSTDRHACMFVSRTFRYAVYLSAAHILSNDYAGRRLDAILVHPKNMTNFWPYLRFRIAEVSERRYTFKRSFLGQYTHSIGYDPLSKRLWTSPDDEKQVDVAIRFVLTRMWFAISVGAYGHDASTWSRCVIRDVREVVKDEVWQVITRDNKTGVSCSFYVLEATCEVIGQPPSSQAEDTLGYHLRADWTTWISQRLQPSLGTGPSALLECVKWSNTEDYHRGISKAWWRRVQDQDADSIAKRSVAERYILASVVANGISGQWMSTSAMAQEFAGLPSKDISSRTAGRSANTVNMYLPSHHHIESVHFTTSKGEALHGAVAVVQTPGREYYVLRDNGMQVGCEEEGIPEVWQQILGCDTLGRAR